MTPSQKRFVEIPLLLVILWLIQAAQICFLRLPLHQGALDFFSVFLIYFAITRSWGKLGLLALLFSYVGSFTVGYPTGIYVATQMWAALIAKLFVKQLALEGRRPFVLLVAGGVLLTKSLVWLTLRFTGSALPFMDFLLTVPVAVICTAVLAYIVFPYCVAWDEYFQHPVDQARELNPDVLR